MPLDQLHEEERYQKIRGEMSFFDHISELRKHLLRSALAIAVGGIVAFMNKTFLFETLIFGPKNPDFITYRTMCYLSQSTGMGDTACFRPPEFHLITRELGEVLMQHLYVSFWIGLIIAFPYILFEIWRFVSPGLHEHEQKAAKGIIGICTFLFFLGVAFGYFIIAPFSISFLAGYTVEGLEVAPVAGAGRHADHRWRCPGRTGGQGAGRVRIRPAGPASPCRHPAARSQCHGPSRTSPSRC